MVENDVILFIIQSVISVIISIFYIIFLFSDSKFKYIICESFVNNKWCLCKNCCNCEVFCFDGYQICNFCFCNKNSFCHCDSCESLKICDCLTSFVIEGHDKNYVEIYVELWNS